MFSVLDYGLRLTTMSQIDLPKLDRAEKNEVFVDVVVVMFYSSIVIVLIIN